MLKFLKELFSKDYYQTTEIVENNSNQHDVEEKKEEVVPDISEPVISVGKLLQKYPWEYVDKDREKKGDLDLSRDVWYYYHIDIDLLPLPICLIYKNLQVTYSLGSNLIHIESSDSSLRCKHEEVNYLANIIDTKKQELRKQKEEAARTILTYIAQEYLSE